MSCNQLYQQKSSERFIIAKSELLCKEGGRRLPFLLHMKYRGWIPVASGFLSFSNIKGQLIAGRCEEPPEIDGTLESIDKGCRITSTRTLIDRPLGGLRSVFASLDERYDFELRATRRQCVELDEALVGTVIAHPRIERDGASSLKSKTLIAPGIYRECLCWVINFELSRDGCITLDWGSTETSSFGAIVEVPQGDEAAAERLLTFETFSFLKDLIHNHKFHGIDDDSIVVPIKINNEEDDQWKDETARNLHRAIISSLRSRPAQLELTNALGKLGYLRTFLTLAKTPFTKRLLDSLENLERTVEVRLQQEGFLTSAADVVKSTWITIILALVATSMTFVQLLQIPCINGLNKDEKCAATFGLPDSALWIANTVLSNWTTVFIGTFAILNALGYLACRKSILELYSQRTGSDEWDWHLMRFFYGLALTQGKYIAFIWLTVLTSIILSLIGFVIYSLIQH